MTDLLQTNAFLITLLALWMAAAVVSLAYFRFSRNAAAKRRLWPLAVAASAAMLVGLVWVLGFGVAVVAIVAVVVAVNVNSATTTSSPAAVPATRRHHRVEVT